MLKAIKVGSLEIRHPILLAPMAGITDNPYREMVNSFGANIMYSEMISSNAMVRTNHKTLRMATLNNLSNSITGLQLAGSDIDTLVQSVKIATDMGVSLIDINMGCPAKKVVNGIAGSALMKEEALAGRIMKELVKATHVPITVKMRLGWDSTCFNAATLALVAQESGIQLITVHGRTRAQFFSGVADMKAIAEIKKHVTIPVIANGDIKDLASAKQAITDSNANGIMIGRATYGKPWLINQITQYIQNDVIVPEPTTQEKLMITLKHYDLLVEEYGELGGLKMARKHLGWYTKGLHNSAELRAKMNTSENYKEVKSLVTACFENGYSYEINNLENENNTLVQ